MEYPWGVIFIICGETTIIHAMIYLIYCAVIIRIISFTNHGYEKLQIRDAYVEIVELRKNMLALFTNEWINIK